PKNSMKMGFAEIGLCVPNRSCFSSHSSLPELQQAIDAMPKAEHLTFLMTEKDKPFTAAVSAIGFANNVMPPAYRKLHMVCGKLVRLAWLSTVAPIMKSWLGADGLRSKRYNATPGPPIECGLHCRRANGSKPEQKCQTLRPEVSNRAKKPDKSRR